MKQERFMYISKFGAYMHCFFSVRPFVEGGYRIDIYDDEEGPITTVNVTLTGFKFSDDYIIVKNYSENEGIVEELVRLNVITSKEPTTTITNGYVVLPVHKLTEEFIENFIKRG